MPRVTQPIQWQMDRGNRLLRCKQARSRKSFRIAETNFDCETARRREGGCGGGLFGWTISLDYRADRVANLHFNQKCFHNKKRN